jgi:diguanylate cyclase (GGDEF)-like protein/PAS domain S-box-containing protein
MKMVELPEPEYGKLIARLRQMEFAVNESKRVEDALIVSEARYRRLFETAKDGILILDAVTGKIDDVNPFLMDLLGYNKETFVGKKLWEIGAFKDAEASKKAFAELQTKEYIRYENLPLETSDGREIAVEFVSNVYSVDNKRVIQCNIRDITERKKMEELIRLQAFYDPLTNLPNRLLFNERFTLETALAKRNQKKLAVLFLDLDHFKNINDTLGHVIGDKLLKDVARRLRACIRESDMVARIGGDEFNILLCDITVPEETAISVKKILTSVKKPYVIDGHELHVSTSIGISIYPNDSELIDELMKNADMAMYHAKESGRNTFQFYNAAMNIRARERMMLENSLRQAIERGELLAYYQPQVDIATRQITCVEALVRWQHPTLGFLPPMRFLPLAAECGLIQAIDVWMLRTACAQSKAWQLAGFKPLCVSINLSARQFQEPHLAEIVSAVLKETDLDPRYLELEITENVAMHDIELAIRKVTGLTGAGVSFSIDDFGTGYSSLSWLSKLPVQKLKIDQSFIRGIEKKSDNKSIVNAIISLAHNLKLRVIAEGVESEDQLAFLRSSGCDEMQGHLFSRALPPEKFATMMM